MYAPLFVLNLFPSLPMTSLLSIIKALFQKNIKKED